MDQETYMTKMATSFVNELGAIQKEAGIMSALGAIPSMLSRGGGALRSWAGQARRQGVGKMLQSRGKSISRLYQQGAQAAGKGGAPAGWWGGVKQVARSPYGAAAGTLGLGGLAATGGYKVLGGGQPSYPPRY
jgi:hypothetical protein